MMTTTTKIAIPWEYRGPCVCGEGIGGHGAHTGTCPNGKTVYSPLQPELVWSSEDGRELAELSEQPQPADRRTTSGLTITEATLPTTDPPHLTLLTETRLTWQDARTMLWISGLAVGLGALMLWGMVEGCEWVGRQF